MFFTLRFILQAVQRSARFRLCPVKTKRCGTVHPPFYKAVRTFIRCAGTVFPYMGAAAFCSRKRQPLPCVSPAYLMR